MTPERAKAARELLAFYLEAGADALVGEAPVDRMADEPPPLPPPERGRTDSGAVQVGGRGQTVLMQTDPSPDRLRRSGPPLSGERQARLPVTVPLTPDAAIMAAREAAKNAGTLEELRALLDDFEGCALRTTATKLVFADGNPKARIMFVGEAPGRDEDIAGLPFVGRSGRLLDLMMAAIGLDRTTAYIANIIPWRPPGNRDPSPQETTICLPFIRRQIELADPDVLVCLGKPSAVTLLDIKDGILKNRGRWFTFDTGTRQIRATVTLHPAYLLRQPLQKRLAWRDFLAIKKALAN
jgi:DNA polymerase